MPPSSAAADNTNTTNMNMNSGGNAIPNRRVSNTTTSLTGPPSTAAMATTSTAAASVAIPEAYVTLVTSEGYVVGALVLAHSLRLTGTQRPIICMVTRTAQLTATAMAFLRGAFDQVRQVDGLDSRDTAHLALLGRPELGPTFSKVQLWSLLDLGKTVFLDADILVLSSIDDLWGREELSACPDVGWPDCFNSGVFVARPSQQTYLGLLGLAKTRGSFDGGDQGLLNSYFSSWSRSDARHRIPFTYNLTFSASYGYLPAYQHFRDQVKVVHFIGPQKPWKYNRTPDGRVIPRGDLPAQLEYVQKWWDIHDKCVVPMLSRIESHHHHHHQHHQLPHFMTLYNAGVQTSSSSSSTSHHHPAASTFVPVTDLDFAHYRIKWTSDVENYFLKHQLSKPPSRSILIDEESSTSLSLGPYSNSNNSPSSTTTLSDRLGKTTLDDDSDLVAGGIPVPPRAAPKKPSSLH